MTSIYQVTGCYLTQTKWCQKILQTVFI